MFRNIPHSYMHIHIAYTYIHADICETATHAGCGGCVNGLVTSYNYI